MFCTLPSIQELVHNMEVKSMASFARSEVTSADKVFPTCDLKNCDTGIATELVSNDALNVHDCAEDCLRDVKVELENASLWKKFYSEGNEMMVTKIGRKMFPIVGVNIAGLLPNEFYKVSLAFAFVDNYRYRFSLWKGLWQKLMVDENEPIAKYQRNYEHFASPTSGQRWTSWAVLFNDLKITNHPTTAENHVYLPSLRKYKIQLVVTKLDCAHCPESHTRHLDIPLTEFIAVTSYANPKITQLKIANNPAAKYSRKNAHKRAEKISKSEKSSKKRKTEKDAISRSPVNSEIHLQIMPFGLQQQSASSDLDLRFSSSDLHLEPTHSDPPYQCSTSDQRLQFSPSSESETISSRTQKQYSHIDLADTLLPICHQDGMNYPYFHTSISLNQLGNDPTDIQSEHNPVRNLYYQPSPPIQHSCVVPGTYIGIQARGTWGASLPLSHDYYENYLTSNYQNINYYNCFSSGCYDNYNSN